MSVGRYTGAGRPVVDADVYLPRLGRLLPVAFLVDTGADDTTLSSRDWRAAGLEWSDFAAPSVRSAGVGGVIESPVEPAEVRLRHDDGSVEVLAFDIELQPRLPGAFALPSFLGRDILRRYRIVFSMEDGELTLERRR